MCVYFDGMFVERRGEFGDVPDVHCIERKACNLCIQLKERCSTSTEQCVRRVHRTRYALLL